jgi:hypothetical protein
MSAADAAAVHAAAAAAAVVGDTHALARVSAPLFRHHSSALTEHFPMVHVARHAFGCRVGMLRTIAVGQRALGPGIDRLIDLQLDG